MTKRKKNNMNQDISIENYPSIHWKKFFENFSDIEMIKIDKWNTAHLIGYFCKKYKDQYGVDYTFRFNSTAPSKSYEVYNFLKLANMLSSSPNILKDYIDWFFIEKIIAKKRRITSMAFLTEANIVNEYKFKKLLMGAKSVDRTTVIPPIYAVIVQKYGLPFKNYGELAFVKRCIDTGNGADAHKAMLSELAKAGLDITMLDRVK
jgi:hypothetical protein